MRSASEAVRVLYSQQPGMRILRGILMLCLVCLAVAQFMVVLFHLKPSHLCQRDLLQLWLAGRAALDGLDPYAPLARSYFRQKVVIYLPHPTP